MSTAGSTPPPKSPTRRRRGRPSELTRPLLESLCRARALGMSVVRAAKANYIHRDTWYAWLERGLADKAEGKRTLYAELSDRVPFEEARGELVLLKRVDKGSRKGTPTAVAAGKLALDALKATRSGRYGQQLARGRPGEEGPAEQPQPGAEEKEAAPAVDLSKLSSEELAAFRRLLAKARGR